MRTTLTIDDDLAAKLRQLAHERGLSFRVVVNSALRGGLRGGAGDADEPYTVPTFHLGARPGVDITKALALAAALDDEETMRKLDVGK